MKDKAIIDSNMKVKKANSTNNPENSPMPDLPILKEGSTRVSTWLTEKPKEPDVLIYNNQDKLLVRGIVGAFVAAGGTGKTFFMLILSYLLSSGKNFGPLSSNRPLKILVLTAEDSTLQIANRLWSIGKGVYPEGLHVASVYGKIGPLMSLERNKPVRTEAYEWLKKTIQSHPGLDILVLDTKSRFYGLDENNNDHAAQWISCLEALCVECQCTILFTHHVAKSKSKTLNPEMSRGASAVVDNSRFIVGLTEMSKTVAGNLNISDPKNYVMLDVVKTNYGVGLKSLLYFHRTKNGLLEHVDPENKRLHEMADFLRNILMSGEHRVSRADLIHKQAGKYISEDLKKQFPGYSRNRDMKCIIEYAIKMGWSVEKEDRKNMTGKPKIVLVSQ